MKRFLLIGLILVILAGYALMAMGSDEEESNNTGTSTSASTESQQKSEEITKEETTEITTSVIVVEAPEYAKRAAVTAMTNWCAFDEKIHSYSDTSGNREYYYMFIVANGTWTETGTNKWHIVDMQLRTYGKNDGPTEWDSVAYKFTLDIQYDATKQNYIISNVYGSYKETGDTKYTNMKFCASHSLFTVSKSLIEKDRV